MTEQEPRFRLQTLKKLLKYYLFSPSFLRSVDQFNSTLLDACVPLVTSALQISNDDDDDDERRIMMMRSNSWRTRRLH